MRIGILTFHASHNFGSMLQAFALQKYLISLGYDVEEINLRNEVQRHQVYPYPFERKLVIILKLCLTPIWLYHDCRKWKKYERFMNHYIKLSNKTYKSWGEVKEDINRYEVVITGGDQIWNMGCRDFDSSYMLPSNDIVARKVAYCPSFGSFLSKISPEQSSFVKNALTDYEAISVREFSMKDYLEKLLNRNVEVVVDPTLLIVKDDYKKIIEKKPLVKGKYIYYYTPRTNIEFERLAVLLGEHMGMKVVTSFPNRHGDKGMTPVYEVGPSEFLNLIDNAELVVGNSYHLVVFSLILHKEFVAINGKKDARISSFLNYLKIPERGIIDETNYKEVKLTPIDFSKTDRLISQLRESSVDFLNRSLKK